MSAEMVVRERSGRMKELATISPVPTDEEITIRAVMAATTAAFDWRGEGGLTSMEAVNTCAALIAFLDSASTSLRSLQEWKDAIENLRVATGRQPKKDRDNVQR